MIFLNRFFYSPYFVWALCALLFIGKPREWANFLYNGQLPEYSKAIEKFLKKKNNTYSSVESESYENNEPLN